MTMPTDTYGLPSGGFDYGQGAGWLPFLNQQDQLLANLYNSQGALGAGLLGHLTNFLTSPTSGPLGLAAMSAFGGNPQAIASGTGGAGLDNSQYTSIFDALLKGLSQSVMNPGSPFNPANNGQYNTDAAKPPDPNKAPGLTPEAAANAPGSNALQQAWDAFHPTGQTQQTSAAINATPNSVWQSLLPKMLGGGVLGYDSGGLVGLAEQAQGMNDAQKAAYVDTLQKINTLGAHIASMSRSPNEGESSWIANKLRDTASAIGIGGNNFLGSNARVNDISTWDPRVIRATLLGAPSFYLNDQDNPFADPRAAGHPIPPPANNVPIASQLPDAGYASGGVTVGGEPHFITDAKGNTVARITEDGKPEHVGGVGGVEVTPMDPLRNALYEARKAATPGGMPGPAPVPAVNPASTAYGKMLADMEQEVKVAQPGAALGANFLFPTQVPGSQVNTDAAAGGGTNEIPSFGGPSTPGDIGTPFRATGNSLSDMMSSINGIAGSSYNSRFAKLLGGALSSDQAIPSEQRASLNAGLAPDKLLSSQALSTMAPGQRQAYAAMLQQMGVIQSPADLEYWVKQFTPAALS